MLRPISGETYLKSRIRWTTSQQPENRFAMLSTGFVSSCPA